MGQSMNADGFFADAAPKAQPILAELRKMIQNAFPEIEEKIGYGVPQYKYKSVSLGLSVARNHVTLGFDYGAISDEMRRCLIEKGYKLGLQTLQIKLGQDVPKNEIQHIFDSIMQNMKK